MLLPSLLNNLIFISKCYPTFREIVRGHIHSHLISRKYLYIVHSHLPRNVGQDLVAVLELDLEHSIGKRLDYRALKLNRIFFAQLSAALS